MAHPAPSLNVVLLFCIALEVTLFSAAAGNVADGSKPDNLLEHGTHSHSGHRLNPEALRYWSKSLPRTVMPRAVRRLVSPLSAAQVRSFKESMRLGHLVASAEAASVFCSSAHLRCGTLDGLGDSGVRTSEQEQSLWFLEEHLTAGTGTLDALEVPASRFSDQLQQSGGWSFLPQALAGLFRLVQRELQSILDQFHIPDDSPMADAMRNTLGLCDRVSSSPSQGRFGDESGTCVHSLEDLADLVVRMLLRGSHSPSRPLPAFIMALTSTAFPASNTLLSAGRFKVVKVEEKADERSNYLSCHSMIFPFQVVYCHTIPNTKLYSVTLESTALPGYTVTNVVLCHMDTSKWSPDHVSFKLLGKQPGESEACHWSTSDAFAFVLPA